MLRYNVNNLDIVKTRYHHGSLRGALIDAAAHLAAEQGSAAVSLREAARRAGVTQAAPYHYFRNKSALIAAVAEAGFERLEAEQAAASARADRTAASTLTSALAAYVRFAIDRPHYFKVMFRTHLADPGAHPALSAAANRVIERLVDLVRAARAEAGHDDLDPMAITTLMWSIPHGLATLYLDGPISVHGATPVSLEHLVRAAVEPLLSATPHDLAAGDWAV